MYARHLCSLQQSVHVFLERSIFIKTHPSLKPLLSSCLSWCKMTCTSLQCHAGISPCTETQHLSSTLGPGLHDTESAGLLVCSTTLGVTQAEQVAVFLFKCYLTSCTASLTVVCQQRPFYQKQTAMGSNLFKQTYDLNPAMLPGNVHTQMSQNKKSLLAMWLPRSE